MQVNNLKAARKAILWDKKIPEGESHGRDRKLFSTVHSIPRTLTADSCSFSQKFAGINYVTWRKATVSCSRTQISLLSYLLKRFLVKFLIVLQLTGQLIIFLAFILKLKLKNSHISIWQHKNSWRREVVFMVTFLGKCTFSTKVILFSNDFVVLPRARDVLVARRSERQSRETSHSLGACFAQSIKNGKLS